MKLLALLLCYILRIPAIHDVWADTSQFKSNARLLIMSMVFNPLPMFGGTSDIHLTENTRQIALSGRNGGVAGILKQLQKVIDN